MYPRTEAAGSAQQGLKDLSSKAVATQMARQEAEPAGPVLLNLAHRYAQMGRYEEARRCYEQVVKQAPNTVYAKQARTALQELPGK